MHKKLLLLVSLLLVGITIVNAQTELNSDTTKTEKKNIFKRVYEYFEDSNESKPEKSFDFSIIGGPHYSSDTKLGLGMVASVYTG